MAAMGLKALSKPCLCWPWQEFLFSTSPLPPLLSVAGSPEPQVGGTLHLLDSRALPLWAEVPEDTLGDADGPCRIVFVCVPFDLWLVFGKKTIWGLDLELAVSLGSLSGTCCHVSLGGRALGSRKPHGFWVITAVHLGCLHTAGPLTLMMTREESGCPRDSVQGALQFGSGSWGQTRVQGWVL